MYQVQEEKMENRFAKRKAILGLENTKKKFESLVNQVSKENIDQYIEKAVEVLHAYKASGGLGQPIYDYISKLDELFSPKDQNKEELLMESMCRITGLTAPSKRILFKDYDARQQVWN